MHTKHKTLYR